MVNTLFMDPTFPSENIKASNLLYGYHLSYNGTSPLDSEIE